MNMKRIVVVTAVLVAAGAASWFLFGKNAKAVGGYRFVTVERGDLASTVSATGNLEAVTTVAVGTQVSGIISDIFVDFNDKVKKGEVIALIDPTLLKSAVRDAGAALEKTQAQLGQAERENERVTRLYDQKIVSEVDYSDALYALDTAKASEKSAQISLERARQNLAYATIYAPIDGIVIERNVDVGQTVAASLSAPQLFLIANDLSHMQILVSVDESDIGLIREGQAARFTVQAYPDETFAGTVRQVRLQSSIQENVVNYTVVVDVANNNGRLLPGMTATVDFLIETAQGVTKVANAALRFRPTDAMVAEVSKGSGSEPGRSSDTARDRSARTGQGEAGALLWVVNEAGALKALPVGTGITDGQSTEVEGPDIRPGMRVIAGVTQISQTSHANPFQSQQQSSRRPHPPGM